MLLQTGEVNTALAVAERGGYLPAVAEKGDNQPLLLQRGEVNTALDVAEKRGKHNPSCCRQGS